MSDAMSNASGYFLDEKTTSSKDEQIKPDYYNDHPSGVQCIKIIQHYPVCVAFAIKYLWRYGKKGDPVVQIKKAIRSLEMELERLEEIK